MKTYLRFDEFVEQAPSTAGSIRINHDSDECSGSSKSLKIERESNGTINAHCFRCGRSGRFSPDFQRVREAAKNDKDITYSKRPSDNSFPRDARQETGDWPLYARKWIRQWGITNDEIRNHGVAYSTYYDRLCFSVTYRGGYEGYASRAVNPSDTRPKWMRFTKGKPWYYRTQTSDILVLTEDIVSAIKVARHVDSIALLTTTITTEVLSDIHGYSKYVVWLDNDNRQVKMNQVRLAHRLSLLGDVQVVHHTDPKRCNDENIQIRIR